MAHFAKLDETNTVIDVVVVNNSVILNEHGAEEEQLGRDFLTSLFPDTRWVQTSYSNSFRKQYAEVGSTYDPINDIFVLGKPFASWVLNADHEWEAPIPKPEGSYNWVESSQTWVSNEALYGDITDEFAD
jgi:hypothetical protein